MTASFAPQAVAADAVEPTLDELDGIGRRDQDAPIVTENASGTEEPGAAPMPEGD
jgi:hypothetical protein